jgi:putative transposase
LYFCYRDYTAWMARNSRTTPGGVIFHVLNRGVGRRTIFGKDADFHAFERVLAYALKEVPVDLFAYCIMPNHWHLLVRPAGDRDMGNFMHRLTMTHARRWQEHYLEVGYGHLYQGRFKSFPVQDDGHFLTVARYIERNPLRANLVDRAEKWRWSSYARRLKTPADPNIVPLPLVDWPVDRPRDWTDWIHEPQTDAEVEALRQAIAKGKPFGQAQWQKKVIDLLGMESTLRQTGRPLKSKQ